MANMARSDVQAMLEDHSKIHGVVGSVLGVLHGETLHLASAGVLNSHAGYRCSTDAVFQIGSIGKAFTATLVMQLVDSGRVCLDSKVKEIVPELRLADSEVLDALTVRCLLNHTSGLCGDFFPDERPGCRTAQDYVARLDLLQSIFLPGQGPMTYCNSGYVILGRIIEILMQSEWSQAVIERVCRPLAMQRAFATPGEGLRYPSAIGHDLVNGEMVPAAPAYGPISMAAAGTMLSMSMRDLLTFANAHLKGGTHGGFQMLSESAVRRMQEDAIPVPPWTRRGVNHWGLGWALCENEHYRMFGHDGATAGQYCYLRAFPDHQAAFALFTNSASGGMFADIEQELMKSLVGVPPHEDVCFDSTVPIPEWCVGHYADLATSYRIYTKNDALRLHYRSTLGAGADFDAVVVPFAGSVFELSAPGSIFDRVKVSFLAYDPADAQARFFRFGTRMGRRTGYAHIG